MKITNKNKVTNQIKPSLSQADIVSILTDVKSWKTVDWGDVFGSDVYIAYLIKTTLRLKGESQFEDECLYFS